MKKQINKNHRSLLFAIAIIIILGASVSTFAQKQKNLFALNNPFRLTANENSRLKTLSQEFNFINTKSNDMLDSNFDRNELAEVKPDFSEMEKQYEIVKYHYDFNFFPMPALIILVKPKVDDALYKWDIKWRDADGVVMSDSGFYGWKFPVKADEPQWISAYCPRESEMKRVKSIVVKRVVE